jgi:hypothetical protein
MLLARAAEQRHDDAAAAKWLAQVDAKDADLQVVSLRAGLLARQGKLAEALKLIRAANATTPAEQRYKLLTEVQLLLDEKKLSEAREVLNKANAETPGRRRPRLPGGHGRRAPEPPRRDGAAAPHPRAAARQLAGAERARLLAGRPQPAAGRGARAWSSRRTSCRRPIRSSSTASAGSSTAWATTTPPPRCWRRPIRRARTPRSPPTWARRCGPTASTTRRRACCATRTSSTPATRCSSRR